MNTSTIKVSPVNMAERKKLALRAGDTVKVYQKIQEKGKTRLQIFEGLVLAVKHGSEAGATFTVRRVASGVGVEKIFPLYSPMIDKIVVVRSSKVRRSKLYHIRDKAAKEIRRQMRNTRVLKAVDDEVEEEVLEEVKSEDHAVETDAVVEETGNTEATETAEKVEETENK